MGLKGQDLMKKAVLVWGRGEKNWCWILPDNVSSDNKYFYVLWTLGYP